MLVVALAKIIVAPPLIMEMVHVMQKITMWNVIGMVAIAIWPFVHGRVRLVEVFI